MERSIQEIRLRWLETQRQAVSFPSLRKAVGYNSAEAGLGTGACVAGCRSVCWKAFLLFQSDFGEGWSNTLSEHRATYSALRDHFLKYIKHPEELNSVTIDPLADDPTSPWNTVRQDELIRQEILQDVRRLPDEPFYHQEDIQTLILDVMFIYCKLNPDTGYRQGMHELLAPIVYVVYQDAVDSSLARDDPISDALMADILDSSYAEHDSSALFTKLMDSCKPFYETESPSSPITSISAGQTQTSSIVEKSRHIHERCLSRVDPELASHLGNIEVLPQIFLIRWIRLLFGREFPFNQQLILWDTIFALDPTLKLVDFICVAMLLRVRWERMCYPGRPLHDRSVDIVIEADYSGALQLLLKYPTPNDRYGPDTFVNDALYLSTHATPLGGSNIVQKYTGKTPSAAQHAASSSSTPGGFIFSPTFRTTASSTTQTRAPFRAPLPSPARLFGQQDEVKALFSGAAKNVLQHSEKLGINQAVRDAVGDIRRGWSEARSQTGTPRSYAAAATAALAAMERRNRQLALMLDEAFNDLKALSEEDKSDKEAIEMVAAKVHFVKVHLEDSTLALADEEPNQNGGSAVVVETFDPSTPAPAPEIVVLSLPPKPSAPETPPSSPPNTVEEGNIAPVMTGVSAMSIDDVPTTQPSPPVPEGASMSDRLPATQTKLPQADSLLINPAASPIGEPKHLRPPILPTRSNLVQSSFAYMLEDPVVSKDVGSVANTTSSPSSVTYSPSKTHKRGISASATASRERNAFLFGDVATPDCDGETAMANMANMDIFGLSSVKKGERKVM